MIFRSLIFRTVLVVTLGFALSTISILIFSQEKVSQILDTAQEEIYSDKINVILSILERTNTRLENTGLVEAYSADFKKSALTLLKETYYEDPDQKVYPTIIDDHGRVVMDLQLQENFSYQPELDISWPGESTGDSSSSSRHTFLKNDKWYIYDAFVPWKWFVLYAIPLDVKYQGEQELTRTLALIMISISSIALCLLTFFLIRILQPIKKLTVHAEKIAQGDLSHPVFVSSRNEIGSLAESFEAMRLALNDQITALADKEENLRVTLDSIGDCVIATDMQGSITRINNAACNLLRLQTYEAVGKNIEELMTFKEDENSTLQENPVQSVLRTSQSSSFGHDGNGILLLANGTERCIAATTAPIRSAQSEFLGVVLVFRDISRERDVQLQLQHRHRMDAIGQLAGGVAHDFNNMLAGISGGVELLELQIPEDHKGRKLIHLIKTATQRATGLTRKLLDFSRRGKRVSTPVNMHVIIDDVISILKSSIDKRIVMETDLKAEHAMVLGDPAQLQSGILNICVNARDAMPEGGKIYITTCDVDIEDDCVIGNEKLSPGTYLQLSIQDSGVGIPPEIRAKIFEPFFTTKKVGKGTGLGLAAVYGMVQDHHGAITLSSEEGQGTIFHLYLPISPETGVYPYNKTEQIVHGSGTILVIDDEEIIRTTTSLFLQNLGYRVLIAENGQDGVGVYSNHKDDIDLIILDMIMPIMDGREAFEKIIDINPEAKVIVASGYVKEVIPTNGPGKKPVGFLAKPFSHFELSRTIAAVLKKS